MVYFQEITLYKSKNIFFFPLSGHKSENKSDISKAVNNLDLHKLTLNLFVL